MQLCVCVRVYDMFRSSGEGHVFNTATERWYREASVIPVLGQ